MPAFTRDSRHFRGTELVGSFHGKHQRDMHAARARVSQELD